MYHYKNKERETLGDLEFGDKFLDTIPKAHLMREKLLRFGFIKTKNLDVVKNF